MPVAMRWDAFIHSSSSSSPLLGFSAELGDIFVKERLESKLRGVLIEDDGDAGRGAFDELLVLVEILVHFRYAGSDKTHGIMEGLKHFFLALDARPRK